MNTDTGEIKRMRPSEIENSDGLYVPISENDMTKKQKRDSKVSLKDRRSKLGKKLTAIRKQRIVHKNDICPCGSGKKFKYCCQHVKKTERVF